MRQSYGEFILEQERREKKKRMKFILIVLLIILMIAGGTAAAIYFLSADKVKPVVDNQQNVIVNDTDIDTENSFSQEEVDEQLSLAYEAGTEALMEQMKLELEAGESAVEVFRKVYKDHLVMVSDGRYHFVPIREDLKHNNYETENLQILENGEFQYLQNGQVVSYKGIDVSKFQGRVDWNAVASEGVQFAFIRVGNRGYGSGKILDDEMFKRNIEGATKAGIKVGVYFFSQALNETELMEEVNYVLEKIAPYQVDCPVVFDVEMVAGDEGRMDSLTAEERTHLTKLFCDSIEAAGYKSMIYMNLEMASLRLNYEELENYDKWFAYYNPDFYFPYDYQVWQYSESGTIAGVEGTVDMNICFAPIWE